MKKDGFDEFISCCWAIIKCIVFSFCVLVVLAIIPWLITKSWLFWNWGWYWGLFYLVTSILIILFFIEDCAWNIHIKKNMNLEMFCHHPDDVEEFIENGIKIHDTFEPVFHFFFFLFVDFLVLSFLIFYFHTIVFYLSYQSWSWAFWEKETYSIFPKIVLVVGIFFSTIIAYLVTCGTIFSSNKTNTSK